MEERTLAMSSQDSFCQNSDDSVSERETASAVANFTDPATLRQDEDAALEREIQESVKAYLEDEKVWSSFGSRL